MQGTGSYGKRRARPQHGSGLDRPSLPPPLPPGVARRERHRHYYQMQIERGGRAHGRSILPPLEASGARAGPDQMLDHVPDIVNNPAPELTENQGNSTPQRLQGPSRSASASAVKAVESLFEDIPSITQTKLAIILGVEPSALDLWLCGKTVWPSAATDAVHDAVEKLRAAAFQWSGPVYCG